MWIFAGSCFDGGPFELRGVDLWSTEWHRVGQRAADVRDPRYRQPFRFPVYRARGNGRTVLFAAGDQ